MPNVLLLHGGAGSDNSYTEALNRYANSTSSKKSMDPLDFVVEAVRLMEDDPSFNAGTGSVKRIDGSIQMDAAVMANSQIGSVSAIERVKNPVLVAREVMLQTPHVMITGDGAVKLARALGFSDYDPTTERTETIWKKMVAFFNGRDVELPERYSQYYRYAKIFGFPQQKDTVGAVEIGGGKFAAAVSTGGSSPMMRGRVGDSPLPGAGLYAGENGAVVATGIGEEIIRKMMCYDIYTKIGTEPLHEILKNKVEEFGEVLVGAIAVSKDEFASYSNSSMATGESTWP
jgi:L-asparaginase/beta-aspartyl-peptidase (threonine type)